MCATEWTHSSLNVKHVVTVNTYWVGRSPAGTKLKLEKIQIMKEKNNLNTFGCILNISI